MVRAPVVCIVIAGCSSAPSAERPAPPAPVLADAAVDVAATESVPEALSNAPAWVFRYSTAQRSEMWTLRRNGDAAMLVVESATGPLRYLGSASEGTSLVLDVTTGSAKMRLECKREKLAVSAKCNDTTAKPIEVLDCYHADFKTPMPFGPAPGIEYIVDATCNGYRLIAP